MPVPIIDLVRHHAAIQDELDAAVTRVFGHARFILGPEVSNFESSIAERCGVVEAIGVASGSDALLLSLHAMGIGPGDEVLLPTFTFFATASAVTRLGATPIFCDIDDKTYNIDPGSVSGQISKRTRALIAVHLYGQMADMPILREITLEHGIWLVEDAAQAIGALDHGMRAGECGDAGCISFFPTKNLGAAGDAGMVVTDDPMIADGVRLLRTHGARPKYFHKIVGYNSRLDALQAAILGVKLQHMEEWTDRRRAHAEVYDRELKGVGDIETPYRDPNRRHIFHQYTIATDHRDALRNHLHVAGIGSEIYYPRALHLQDCFRALGGRRGDCPVAERASERVLSLPIFPEMTEDEQAEIIDSIKRYYR